jgi:hypothetical protein
MNKKRLFLNFSLEIFILTKTRFILKRSIINLHIKEYFFCNISSKMNLETSRSIKGSIDKTGSIVFDNNEFHLEIREKDLENYKHQKI